ncbi:MAG: hypothetical protein JZU65_24210, partial [Chlorobium sp.]|nr:hypothetical protein [Chlorobium sp.]
QVAASSLIVINKLDLVDEDQAAVVAAKVRQINPEAELVPARYGTIELKFLDRPLKAIKTPVAVESCNTPFNRPTAHVITATGIYDRDA